jgi:hypothetical protein
VQNLYAKTSKKSMKQAELETSAFELTATTTSTRIRYKKV